MLTPAAFSGRSLRRRVKRLIHATRPRFIPACVLPVLVGTGWGYAAIGRLDALVFVLALFATVCVHAASNVLNDVGDDALGTDGQNQRRIYPYTGGSRFIQTGIMSAKEMTRLGIWLLSFAVIAGAILIALKGLVVLIFGLLGHGKILPRET